MSVPVGTTQFHFDETFQGANVGIEAMYTSSLNLNAKAKFQNATVKMLALIPTYDKNAASERGHSATRDGSPPGLHRSISSRAEQVLLSRGGS